jgi:putative FmdB family regulatory protein
MPLYEYECKQCGSVFEILQKLSDPPLTVHEKCGGQLNRLLSPPVFQFKGSGWYVTDYAKGSDKHKPSAEKSAAAETKTETKTEASKPAVKPAAETK